MTIKRRAVAAAFRRMARGVEAKAAYANTVRFYRSSGQEWAQQLGQESTQPSVVRITGQEKLEQREALRRAAVAEQQKRKGDFARNCIKPGLTEPQLEACRAAYRRL